VTTGSRNLGRAFHYAGARSVLMSLWSVAGKSSVTLVERFFKHLKEGKPKLEALKLARQEIRRAGYDHRFTGLRLFWEGKWIRHRVDINLTPKNWSRF
jgi:CHAT domain-containing protein